MAFIESLRKPELAYEVALRTGVNCKSKTVEQNRKLLRGLFKKQISTPDLVKLNNIYSHDTDLIEIKETVQDIQNILDAADALLSDSEVRRISDRLKHVSLRLSRLKPAPAETADPAPGLGVAIASL